MEKEGKLTLEATNSHGQTFAALKLLAKLYEQ